MASGSSPFSARTWKLVRSWPVAALTRPPRASITSTISRAERPPAPLNTMCSSRCAQPDCGRVLPARAAAGSTDRAKVSKPGHRVRDDPHAVGQGVDAGSMRPRSRG